MFFIKSTTSLNTQYRCVKKTQMPSQKMPAEGSEALFHFHKRLSLTLKILCALNASWSRNIDDTRCNSVSYRVTKKFYLGLKKKLIILNYKSEFFKLVCIMKPSRRSSSTNECKVTFLIVPLQIEPKKIEWKKFQSEKNRYKKKSSRAASATD